MDLVYCEKELANKCTLLETHTYDTFAGGRVWPVHYWGSFTKENHQHYRHPQVLILDVFGQRVEFIGLHLKSKFVNGGSADWKAGGTRKEDFIKGAIKARIKLTTEASNVRRYIEKNLNKLKTLRSSSWVISMMAQVKNILSRCIYILIY